MEITQPEEKRRLTRRQAISLILAGLGLILLVTGLWRMRRPDAPPERGLELSAVSLAEGWSLRMSGSGRGSPYRQWGSSRPIG